MPEQLGAWGGQRFSLAGKRAIVTGAVGILGKTLCAALAEAGAEVAVVDIKGTEASDYASELQGRCETRCIGVQCDVADAHSVREMADKVVRQLGGIDLLLNNAAGKSSDLEAFFAPFEDYTLAQWREIMAVNLDGMFLVSQAVGKQMIAQQTGGTMVFTSSIYGMLAPDDRIYEGSQYLGHTINTPAVYAASKSAVTGLANYLAARWAKHRIRVNTLTPGGVESGQNSQFIHNDSQRVPLQRMAHPSEMAGAAVFLASDAASYVTGHNLVVDGGLHVW